MPEPTSDDVIHELEDVRKTYHTGKRVVEAVRGVTLRIRAGEFVSLMGPSGSGKSTLLHLLGALDVPTSGRVLFRGQDLQKLSDKERSLLRRFRIGFIFQFFNLLPTLTAAENVGLPLLLAGRSRAEAQKLSMMGLERVHLDKRAHHFPDEMSGGEMQRVAIARALVTQPDVVICDEPTGNLDSTTSAEILALLRSLPEAGRRSVVMVTHDAAAAQHADRLLRFRDGKIESEEILTRNEVGSMQEIESLVENRG